MKNNQKSLNFYIFKPRFEPLFFFFLENSAWKPQSGLRVSRHLRKSFKKLRNSVSNFQIWMQESFKAMTYYFQQKGILNDGSFSF